MSAFDNADEVYATVGQLCIRMSTDSEIGPKVSALDMAMRLSLSEPTASIVVDCRGDKTSVSFGDFEREPDLDLSMSSEDAHLLWIGELSPTTGMFSRRIKPTGNIKKALKLSPILGEVAEMYREVLVEQGRPDLVPS